MIRLFVALELPEHARARLALLGGGIPGARWIPSENLHLTLRFIGEVDEGRMEDIDAALQSVEAPRFEMFLEGVGFFGRPKAARSVHAGIARNPALAHLRDKIESALVRAGFEPEERKFSAHVTLARLQDAPASRIMEFVSGNNLFREGPIAVDRFALMSSFRSGNGTIYRAEQYYALGPPAGADAAATGDGGRDGD